MRRVSAVVVTALLLLGACGSDGDGTDDAGTEAEAPERVVSLLDAVDETILGQEFAYPDGDTQVTASILTLQPGEETGWHHHEAPLFAYIMEGAVTVDYGDDGTRTYEAGEAFIEAIGTSHNGMTDGDAQVRIMVVNLGAAGAENTVSDE